MASSEEKIQRQLRNTKRKLRRALPHGPEGENDNRAAWAKAAVMTHRQLTGAKRKEALGGLLCDIMHLCDRDHRYRTFENSLDRAKDRYEEETADPYL